LTFLLPFRGSAAELRYDLNGKKVVLVNSLNSTNKVVVSTQGLAKGVYVLEISSEKSKIIKKVVVN
jgi:hypothetical protein